MAENLNDAEKSPMTSLAATNGRPKTEAVRERRRQKRQSLTIEVSPRNTDNTQVVAPDDPPIVAQIVLKPPVEKMDVPPTKSMDSAPGLIETTADKVDVPPADSMDLGQAASDVISGPPVSLSAAKPAYKLTSLFGSGPLAIHPPDKVYVQRASRFFKTEREKVEISIRNLHGAGEFGFDGAEVVVVTSGSDVDVGISFQNGFHRTGIILQGILSGFSICHTIWAYYLIATQANKLIFLQKYASLAIGAQAVYYFLLVVCALSVLDRYDVTENFKRVLWRAVTFQSGGLAVIFYLMALILNSVSLSYDEHMSLIFRNSTFDFRHIAAQPEIISMVDSVNLTAWLWLLICKAILVSLSWIVLAARPGTNLLVKHLKALVLTENA